MQSVIRSIFILFSLGFFTVASAQLPPEIRADAYLLQAEQAIRNGDTFRAQAAIQNILRLQKEHELDLSDEFHFRYAKAADAVDLSEQALEAVLKYLAVSGREGQHYLDALALMNKMQMAVSCNGLLCIGQLRIMKTPLLSRLYSMQGPIPMPGTMINRRPCMWRPRIARIRTSSKP